MNGLANLRRIRTLSTITNLKLPNISSFNINFAKDSENTLSETWFDKLSTETDYNFTRDLSTTLQCHRYKSFDKCFSKTLTKYSRGLYKEPYIIEALRKEQEINNDQPTDRNQFMLDFIHKSLKSNNDSLIIHERLKISRLNAPFYLHQQFQLNLVSKEVKTLIQVYFELPKPRAKHLKRNELEKFLSLLLKLKFQKENKYLIPDIIKIYQDIIYNGHGIKLTRIEKIKYFTLLCLNLGDKVNKSSLDKLMLIKSNLGLNETCESWTILHSFFPQYYKIINKSMSNYIGVNRLVLPLLLSSVSNFNQLQNLLKIVRLRNIHIDSELIDLILLQYVKLGKSSEAAKIVTTLIHEFSNSKSAKVKQSAVESMKIVKTMRQKFNSINLARNAIVSYKLKNNARILFEDKLLPYPILPSSSIIGKLLLDSQLQESETLDLILLAKIHKIPLSYNHIYKILEKTKDLDILRTVLEILIDTDSEPPLIHHYIQQYNNDLYNAQSNSSYDTLLRKEFSGDFPVSEMDERKWLTNILKKSIEVHDYISSGNNSIDFLVQQRVQSLIVDLNSIL